MERWLPIEGSEAYAISDEGRVMSNKRREPRILAPVNGPNGYLVVWTYTAGKRRMRFIHRLVLEHFTGPPKPGQICRHLNGDPRDNRLENLQWGTHAENMADKVRHGTQVKGEAVNLAKLTRTDVVEIRIHLDAGWSQSDVARKFKVDVTTIKAIAHGRTWKHVEGGPDLSGRDWRLRGERNKSAKLTVAKVREARTLHAEGWTFTALGERYGVSRVAIRNAVVGQTWKTV